LCDTALGTDSSGSVRVPASLCGLYGLRPTHGRISFAGGVTQSPSFDTPGWFARDAATFARVAEVMLGVPIPEVAPAKLLLAEDCFEVCDAGVAEALRPAVARVAAVLGGEPVRMSLGQGELAAWMDQRGILQRGETWKTFQPWIDAVNPCFAFNVARGLAAASAITPAQIAVAQVVRERVRERARALLEGGAILCMPTTPYTAPRADMPLHMIDAHADRLGLLTSFAGLARLPQLNLPLGEVFGKPIGLSIIAWRG
jgi:amidase